MHCPLTMSISTTSHGGDILLGSNYQEPVGGDRTHDRGIMRWEQSVGLVPWCRIRPSFTGIVARWCRFRPVVSVWSVRLSVGFVQSNSSRRFVSGSDHPDLARNTGVFML